MNATEVVSSPSRNVRTTATDANHFILTFENNRLASELFGQFDQHLKLLEQRLQIEARARGNSVAITGELQATAVDVASGLKAPVEIGQPLGRVSITLAGEQIGEEPLVALEAVERGGFFTRFWDALVLFFLQLFGKA